MAGRHRFTGGLPHGPDLSATGDTPRTATAPRWAGDAGRVVEAGRADVPVYRLGAAG